MMRSLGGLVFASALGLAAATEEAGSRWAVIAAGSSGFWNYRHQADACHAYQVMRKSGIPASNIILMMQDDVANSNMNPFPGQLFNKPGNDSVDVYKDCQIDYRGSIVTAELFVKVITGDDSNLPAGGSGKVLKSKATDRVFLNFVDHGGVGLVAFPNGPVLYAKDLSKALQAMQAKQMFKELVFYMEACESGSMFPDLTKDGKIFAVTAANAQESSWGFYCGSEATVRGKSIGSCLGDLFSISWLEDSDLGDSSETIQTQVERVTKRTSKSHVMTFGDLSLESESIGSFLASPALSAAAESPRAGTAYNVRDIPLHTAYSRWARAEAHEKAREYEALERVVANRAADEAVFGSFAQGVCGDLAGCGSSLASSKMQLKDYDCHKAFASIVQESCPRREEHNSGGWNGFNMKYSQMLANVCESRDLLQKSTEDLAQVMRDACSSVGSAASVEQIVV
jgi:legumain